MKGLVYLGNNKIELKEIENPKIIDNKDVIVTVQLSEPIQEVEGWELSEDKLTLTKPYTENKTEEIIITDLSGNTNTVKIEVNNIDKNPPKIEITNIKNTNTGYENYANKTHTITATIKINNALFTAITPSVIFQLPTVYHALVPKASLILQNLTGRPHFVNSNNLCNGDFPILTEQYFYGII